MAFKDLGGTLVDLDEIAAVQNVYGGGVDLILRGGAVVKVSAAAKLDGKPLVEALTQWLTAESK